MERELLGPTPRRIERKTPSGAGCLYVFLALYVVIGIGLLAMAVMKTMIVYHGVAMPAVATTREDNSDSESSSYSVDYIYEYHNITYSGNSQISKEDYAGMEPGRPLTVRALASAPGYFPVLQEFSTDEPAFFWMAWCGAVLWWACAPLIVWSAFLWPRTVRRILREGVPIAARVTDKKMNTSDDVTWRSVHYEFTPLPSTRPPVTGKISVDESQWDKLSIGGALTVIYDPARPKQHVVYRLASYRVVGNPR
ncbi:hypothetical protein CCAX7_12490 [Capsulimonas corticalis]|uniref:DUF3592 domain-containing protein n=1 Tax=Capsulimonas corticalis TaxID=2219043 RepID=A0A9N7L1N2_9BACT|nr:hypothetical protein CCAX7_12490 [Capsulimonas corticalis]